MIALFVVLICLSAAIFLDKPSLRKSIVLIMAWVIFIFLVVIVGPVEF